MSEPTTTASQSTGGMTLRFYYDPTPDGDFANPQSFCGGEEGAMALGGDRLLDSSAAEWGYDRGYGSTGSIGRWRLPGPTETRS